MKGDTKCQNGVVWRSYESLKVTGNSIIRYSTYELLLAFNSMYVLIMHHFWDITRY